MVLGLPTMRSVPGMTTSKIPRILNLSYLFSSFIGCCVIDAFARAALGFANLVVSIRYDNLKILRILNLSILFSSFGDCRVINTFVKAAGGFANLVASTRYDNLKNSKDSESSLLAL
jgi:hypothetical protein